jgi:hypothetical protein
MVEGASMVRPDRRVPVTIVRPQIPGIAVVGDWSGYVIGDRIGSQVELVPSAVRNRNPHATDVIA